jgi:hypothetical protein
MIKKGRLYVLNAWFACVAYVYEYMGSDAREPRFSFFGSDCPPQNWRPLFFTRNSVTNFWNLKSQFKWPKKALVIVLMVRLVPQLTTLIFGPK